MSEKTTFRLRGQVFSIPAMVHGINLDQPDQRLVGGLAATAVAVRHGDTVLVDSFEPAAVDLGLVRANRCPLLIEHMRRVDYLIGGVADAWVENGGLHFIARLAEGGEADRIWSMMRQGFALSVSVGAGIIDAEPLGVDPGGGERFRATRWQLSEISVCVHGMDENAGMCRLNNSAEARARLAKRAREADGNARLAVRRALHVDRWERWAIGAGLAIAQRIGADPDVVCDALDEQVRRHVERLQDELAA